MGWDYLSSLASVDFLAVNWMKFFGKELNVPLAFDRYLAIKREFVQMAKAAANSVGELTTEDDFGAAWQMSERASLPEGICTWGKKVGRDALQCVVEKGVATLTERGCYSVDENRYEENYLDLSGIDECAESSASMTVLRELEDDEIKKEWERQDRTERWGNHWVGGTWGGGIKGALKGALKAEIMNAGGALLSGAANKFTRSRSRDEMVNRSEQVFGYFCQELAEAVRAAVCANVDGYVRCLNENLKEDISADWPGRDESAAKGLLGNLSSGRIPADRRKEAIGEMLRLDPLSADAYDWVYRNENRLRKDVESLSEYFCVQVDAIDEDRQQKAAAKEERAKQQAEKRREAHEAAKAEDEARRTVFGMVWPTVEEREAARANKQTFFDCVEALVAKYDGQDGFAANRLTKDKLAKIQAVFETLPNERVIWLLDTSFWYNASYGLLVTDKGLRWKNRKADFSKITNLCWNKFGESEKCPKMLKDGAVKIATSARFDPDVNGGWKDNWLPIIVSMWEYWREGTFEKVGETMSVTVPRTKSRTASQCGSQAAGDITETLVLKAIADVGGGLYCNPNIPEKKLINAKVAMSVPPGEVVFALMDTTFFGSAKNGAVLTNWGVRWMNDWSTETKLHALSWEELKTSIPFSVNGFDLKLTAGAVINTAGGGMSAANLAKVIGSVVGKRESEQ